MTSDDLNTPLGQASRAHRWAFLAYWPHAVAGALAAVLLVFGLWVMIASNPLGGEPMARVAIPPQVVAKPSDPTPAKKEPPVSTKTAETATPPGSKTVTIIDGSSGRKQEVVVRDPQASGKDAQGASLLETSRHGPIPKIADDGTRPADVYAKPGKTADPNMPRIAVIVSGLGVSSLRTSEAIDKLPAAVTLAFMPYPKDLDQWISRASQAGHELLLQAPMEPFDFPDNDPGPQTLLTTLAPDQNIDRLRFFMSRFQGYIGVMNYAGGRFTATEQALSPVLREIAKRGLIYFDDGASPRSVASQIAGANRSAFAKADVVIDSAPTASDLEMALSRLETIARDRGVAIGIASALPVAIDRIGQWAKRLEDRGIALVPLSAVTSKPKSS